VQAIKRARRYGEKASVPWKQVNREAFGYIISESLSREQRGKMRGMLELLGEKRGA